MIQDDEKRVSYIDKEDFIKIVTKYAKADKRSRNELFQHVMRIFLRSKGVKFDE